MRELQAQGGSGRTAGHSHESRDMSVKLVMWFSLALTATLVGAHFLMEGVFAGFADRAERRDRPHPPLRMDRVVPPEPRLQENPGGDLEKLRRAEDRRLESYGWIDRERKILRIPIDRAMDQMIRKGVPSRPSGPSAD
jgi:hypothetical protein